MVKIHIQIMIEEPNKEEWNQLMQLAQKGNAMLDDMGGVGEIILDDPVEGLDESVSAQAVQDAKKAEKLREEIREMKKLRKKASQAIEAEKKAKAEKKRLEKEEKKKKQEAARVAAIEKALDTSMSLEEVYATLKKNKVPHKRTEVKVLNKHLKESLPARTPMFSIGDEELRAVVMVSFGQHLIDVIKNKWFNKKWSLKSAEGKAMLKHFMTRLAGTQKYDPSYLDKCREIICDIVDPATNPERGRIAEEAYVLDGDVYEFTPDWAHHVLMEEILPAITEDNNKANAPLELNFEIAKIVAVLKKYKNHS